MTEAERAAKVTKAQALLDELESILVDLDSDLDCDFCGALRDHIDELA